MKNSIKHLLRTPARTALFFLLMAATTLLLVFSGCLLSETSQRISEVESTFTTVARVEQVPALSDIPETWYNECWGKQFGETKVWDDPVTIEDLQFEGANYVAEPEYRPYYLTEHPDWKHIIEFNRAGAEWIHIFEFTALEDSDELGGANVRVERVLLRQHNLSEDSGVLPPKEGMEVFVCQCGGTRYDQDGTMIPLEKGKRYIASVMIKASCNYHEIPNDYGYEGYFGTDLEYILEAAPYSSQHDAEGNEIRSDHFPYLEDGSQNLRRIEEVTEDFYEGGGRGQDWLVWANTVNQSAKYFPVMPTSGLQMLPVFQENYAYVAQGREITQEEFDSGALVCMVPNDMLVYNRLNIGDKVSLPLLCSLYGSNAKMSYMPTRSTYHVSYGNGGYIGFSPLSADGTPYEPFWEAEYEIVGSYGLIQSGGLYDNGEIYPDTILIPKNSVGASDENNIAYYNYLDGKAATFQIENGTIDEFDAALRANVPQAESLLITYNDNGYTEIMETLQSTRSAAQLLFAVGLLAAVAILLLLLYFFVAKEKKRTAIEQSLGMTKRQCRVSLLSGVLVLTVVASCLGSLGGAAAMEVFHRQEQAALVAASEEKPAVDEIAETDTAEENSPKDELLDPGEYNPKYSPWAKAAGARQTVNLNVRTPVFLYAAVPLAIVLLVFVLSLLLVNHNLKIKPIYLLSTKSES